MNNKFKGASHRKSYTAKTCNQACGCPSISKNKKPYWHMIFIIPALLLAGAGMLFGDTLRAVPFAWAEYAVFAAAYLLVGWQVLLAAGKNFIRGKLFNEYSLMTIATLGAFTIQALPEAVAVMLFFRVGEMFQEHSVSRSRKSIQALLDVRPDYARLKKENSTKKVSPGKVQPGDTIIVHPGEKIPLDGEVESGHTIVDTSPITGEPVPRSAGVGSMVAAGTINLSSLITVRVTKKFAESSIAKILELVENAIERKAPAERFITTFARYYTPAVVMVAVLIAIIPPVFVSGQDFSTWFYRSMVLLVISCPCALVVSVPLTYFAGIGGASRKGILFKGAAFLDIMNGVKKIVFDKTGTLTKGSFKVKAIVPHNGYSQEALLELAASIEAHSSHPIALSIQQAHGEPATLLSVNNLTETSGLGVRAKVGSSWVMAGNQQLLNQHNISTPVASHEGTIVHLSVDDDYAGYIAISDELKEEATLAVQRLKELGVEDLVMLTGDSRQPAEVIARRLELDQFHASLLPEEKLDIVEGMLEQIRGKNAIAVVGDGINDSPILARADVGIAMGGLGSDAAIETADVVIMDDNLTKLAQAVRIARTTRRIVWQNIILTLGVKGAFLALGAVGLATMWSAVFADVGVTLLAIINAVRAAGKGGKAGN